MSFSEHTCLAIFASGTGSNALKIIEYFADHPSIRVCAVFCNNPNAGVLGHAYKNHIPAIVITKRLLNNPQFMTDQLNALHIDRIVLAGFLLLMPEFLVAAYPGKIVNIHPALLPKFGGKGMYGMRVHEAVIQAGERHTGITIHIVNEHYDEGKALFTTDIPVDDSDTPESLAEKVHTLEHAWYPRVIEDWIMGRPTVG